jgi:hypothetical protein
MVASKELIVDPDGSYDDLFDYNRLYNYYASIIFTDTVVVTKYNYDPELIGQEINFPSEKEINAAIENVKTLHLIDTANSFNNSIISYPQTTFYKSTLAQVVNQTTTALTTKTVNINSTPIPAPQYEALIEFFKVVENDAKTGRVEINAQLVESKPFSIGPDGLRTLVVFKDPSIQSFNHEMLVIDTKTPSSIYKHTFVKPNGDAQPPQPTRYPAKPDGSMDINNIIYSIVRDPDGKPIIDPKTKDPLTAPTIRFRWFDHPDAFAPNDINKRTIGYGHIITKPERESQTIKVRDVIPKDKPYLKTEVTNIYTQGLRDEDVNDLLNLDVIKRFESVKVVLGIERYKWLAENYPSRLAVLVNVQYNGGNYGIRSFPALLYYVGLINNIENGYDANGGSRLEMKNKDGGYTYSSISSLIGEFSFKPKTKFFLDSPFNIQNIVKNAHIKRLDSRSWIIADTFIYFGNSPTPKPKNAQTSYAEIIAKTKKPFNK